MAGWTNANAYDSLGFTVAAGLSVAVDQITLTSRSSATGPGFIIVQASVDGGAFTTVASITQSATNYNDEVLAIPPVTATRSLVFEFLAANQTSAGGGTLGSGVMFRLGDDNPPGTTPTPFAISGTISSSATVPEPSGLVLTALGLASVGRVARVRRRTA